MRSEVFPLRNNAQAEPKSEYSRRVQLVMLARRVVAQLRAASMASAAKAPVMPSFPADLKVSVLEAMATVGDLERMEELVEELEELIKRHISLLEDEHEKEFARHILEQIQDVAECIRREENAGLGMGV